MWDLIKLHEFNLQGWFKLLIVPAALFMLYVIDRDPTVKHDLVAAKSELLKAIPVNHHVGIDISHYQGDLLENLKKHQGIDFVICKATQGITYTDPMFATNWRVLKEQGMLRGTYHFYMADDPPLPQARHFYEMVQAIEPTDLPPIIDVEKLGLRGDQEKWKFKEDLKRFIKEVEKLFARRPMIYTNYEFAQAHMDDDWFAQYPLWIADYQEKQQPRIPDAWKEHGYKIWQKSSAYHVDSENTDLDVFVGHKQDLLH